MTILAWHGNPDLKADAVARMKKHREFDEFLRGQYLSTPGDADELLGPNAGRRMAGCFHGCLTAEKLAEEQGVTNVLNVSPYKGIEDIPGNGWHAQGQRVWGIPAPLGALLDRIFETAFEDDREAGQWAVAVTEAIPVGADLRRVHSAWEQEVLDDLHDTDRAALIIRLLSEAPIVGVDS